MRALAVLFACLGAAGCTETLDFQHPVADDAGASGSAGQSGVTPLGPSGEYRLTFVEDCEAPLDGARWNTFMLVGDSEFRTWGQRQEYMADENVTVSDGHCVITAEARPSGGQPYTSGTLNTAGLFAQEHGYFEARLWPPAGNGLWSVWWLRSLQGWPPAIEGLGYLGSSPTQGSASYWWTAETGDPDGEIHALEGTDFSAGFHVYGIEWSSDAIAFYLDGVLARRFEGVAGRVAGPLYLAFNLSLATAEEGRLPPDVTTPFPSLLRIDWVRAFAAVP